MAQQGLPPRRPGRHTAPDPDPGPDPYRPGDPYAAAQAPPPQAPPPQAPPPQGRQAPPRPGLPRTRRGSDGWGDPFAGGNDDGPEDLPPWAGPSIHATRAGGRQLRPPGQEMAPEPGPGADEAGLPGGGQPRRRGRGRAAAARLRKSRRRVVVYCGAAIVVAVVAAGVLALRHLPRQQPKPSFITTLQPGEYATVPSACGTVSPALISSYLPGGKVTKVNPAGTSASYSQCSLTVDTRPVFRVLTVTSRAYQPSAVVSGNGSATANAVASFAVAEQNLRNPGKKSATPPAQVTPVAGLGTEALRAVQVVHTGPVVNDLVTVMVRQRNLVVTVTFQAQAAGHGFGPVDLATVRAGGLAAARAVLAADLAGQGKG